MITTLVEPLRKCLVSQKTYQKVYLAERDASTGLTRFSLSEKNLEIYLVQGLLNLLQLIRWGLIKTDDMVRITLRR